MMACATRLTSYSAGRTTKLILTLPQRNSQDRLAMHPIHCETSCSPMSESGIWATKCRLGGSAGMSAVVEVSGKRLTVLPLAPLHFREQALGL
jgi:hypothetical protein